MALLDLAIRDGQPTVLDRLMKNMDWPTIFDMKPLSGFNPEVEASRSGDDFLVKVDAPGISPEQLNIELDGHMLTISGERTEETSSEERLYTSRSYGSFSRSWRLPAQISSEEIEARHDNGVLEVRVRNAYGQESSGSTKIEIKTESKGLGVGESQEGPPGISPATEGPPSTEG